MAELFALISGAAGVVSLGLTVCQGLVAYYGPFTTFSSETENFLTRVKGLSATLELLQSKLNHLEGQAPLNPYITDELQLVTDRINDCGGALQSLSDALAECQGFNTSGILKKNGWKFAKTLYPFRRGTIIALMAIMTGLQSNLDIALQVLLL
ncbi:uncharacterized protein DSM5745_01558 [Aspergillus mulundensis]|uniref:Fungal N-terminal domain-containing protein n=1 Tax=Aspergillus mulundensis TaxID=1810919 RepID=A0A3D8T6Q2_9EURO|nr:hypothetical protein DSM5745_01558 [Aspergillus mulundensis]RDW94236.1 hypothetical protein DSM5745_01558 [Aspergillus mulundensis]